MQRFVSRGFSLLSSPRATPRGRARPVLAFVALALALASVAPARAQVTGQIAGNVFDQNGMPLKGVKVSAKSETDITPKNVYTNDEGFFRIIGLMPGKFDLTASSPGLQTFVQKNIQVGITGAVELTIIMEVKTAEVDYVIEQKTPLVQVTSAKVTEKFDGEFLDNLPLADRTSIQSVLANQVAGAVGSQNAPQVRGGNSTQNSYQLEGFQVNDVGGNRGQIIPFKTVAALEMSTGGYGAENAQASGAVVNAVTKSGSNRYEFEIAGDHMNTLMRLFLDDLDPRAFGMEGRVSMDLSGPIIKDRLWFFTTYEYRNNIFNRERDPLGLRATPPRQSDNSVRSAGKFTLQLTARNKLQLVYNVNRDWQKNTTADINFDRDAQTRNRNFDLFSGLIWDAILTDSLMFRSQFGLSRFTNDFGPQMCETDPKNCDHIPGLRDINPVYNWQNFTFHRLQNSGTVEFKNTLNYFADSKALGNHDIKLTGRFYGAQMENKESTPGDVIYVFDNGVANSKRELFVNDPTQEPGRLGWAISNSSSRMLHFSLQDQFKPPGYRYLTLTPGVGYFITDSSDGAGNQILKFNTATPHIQAAWDATHDGRTVIRGGFNQYVDAGNLNVANFVGANRTVRICDYDPVRRTFTQNCRYEGGRSRNVVGQPCGPDGLDANGNSCSRPLDIPRTWEYMLGFEREIVQGIAVRTDFQYRSYEYQYETREVNRIWNQAGTDLDPTGGFRNGRPYMVMSMETPEEVRRRYIGVNPGIVKREGKFKLNFSYQWARLEGNVVNGFNNPFLNNPVQDLLQYGFLPGDSRHTIRSQFTYQFNAWFSSGFIYNYTSGTPVQLVYWNQVNNGFTDFRARRGYHPGLNINDAIDDREYRLPDIQEMGIQLRANLRPVTRFDAEFYADILNLLALRTTTGIRTQSTDPGVGLFASRMQPMRLRLGFRFKY